MMRFARSGWSGGTKLPVAVLGVLVTGLLGAAPAGAAPRSLNYDVRMFPLANGVFAGASDSSPFGRDTVALSEPDGASRRVTLYNPRGELVLDWEQQQQTASPPDFPCITGESGSGQVSGFAGAYAHATGSFDVRWTENGCQPPPYYDFTFDGHVDFGRPGRASSASPLRPGSHRISAHGPTVLALGSSRHYVGLVKPGGPFRPRDVIFIDVPNGPANASDAPLPFTDGHLSIYGIDGSRLSGSLEGTQSATQAGAPNTVATLTVRSTAGRFAGLRGHLRFSTLSYSPSDTGSGQYTLTGRLTRKAPHRRGHR